MVDGFCAACLFVDFVRAFIQVMGSALWLLILGRVILSWVRLPIPVAFQKWLFDITEPILAPIRKALGMGGMGFDFSPIIAILLIGLIQRVLLSLVPVYY